MIDLDNDVLLTIPQAAARLPGRVSVASIYRWMQRGIRKVRLSTVLIGGRRFVSLRALEEFIAATTAAANGESAPPRTPRQRARAIAAAERKLADAGIE
jgi:hypothetical protein